MMKIFEIGLFIISCLLVYGYVFGFWMQTKKRVVVGILGLALLLSHAVLEGFRFQLIPLYLVLALFGVEIAIRLMKKNPDLPVKPSFWKRVVAGSISTFLLAATLMVSFYFYSVVKIPEPTGPYAVGVTNYHWIDNSREEMYADPPVDHRELMIRVWYPAELTDGAKKAPYALDSETTSIVANKLSLDNRWLLKSFLQAEHHTYTDVPLADNLDQYPVLILSPGFGFSPYMYTSQIEALVSHGYIVFGIDHPYHAEIPTVFPERRMAEGEMVLSEENEEIDEQIMVWVEDILFSIDKINELNGHDPQGLMTGRLDISRMGMFGHSFGGAVTAQVMDLEPQIIAGVNMDGFFYGPVIEEGLAHPFMLLTGSDEMILNDEEGNPVPKEEYPQWAKDFVEDEKRRREGAMKNNGVTVVLEEADHLSFSDVMLYPSYFGLAEYDAALLEKINQNLLEFFHKHMKDVSP
ncbi:hypothetical protein HXA31_15700 [Salipaludibacillus agaradhaerens]|uniref:Carboxylic ester hydrolase n=1 Tax=Salipaludibacillus agaradhaerens TaxID=76935 RepID=A0A9Q4G1D3_SALAG|nr:hypothetical protein [Salipaludibacillus agaradhaerens]MCR6098808.1 hypothetical protein [Salipaludibacillus agaradhaerens]MCR6115815.1 hypothetical protein [Salipaludibacillus agaradhaerens]